MSAGEGAVPAEARESVRLQGIRRGFGISVLTWRHFSWFSRPVTPEAQTTVLFCPCPLSAMQEAAYPTGPLRLPRAGLVESKCLLAGAGAGWGWLGPGGGGTWSFTLRVSSEAGKVWTGGLMFWG